MVFATSSRLSVSPYKNASTDSTSIHMTHSIPINSNTLPLFDKRMMPAHFATNCSCVCILSGAKEKSHSTILYRVNARERLNTPNRSPVIDHWPYHCIIYVIRHSTHAFEFSDQKTKRATGTLGNGLSGSTEIKKFI